MKFKPEKHHRRSIRLHGYDYSQSGAYFVTICTQNRECLLGEIAEGEMQPSPAGKMVQAVWDEIPVNYPGIDVAEFVLMPNHVHGVIVIVGAPPCGRPEDRSEQARGAPMALMHLSLPDVVHRFKTMTTKRYTDGVRKLGWPPFPGKLWQRNYWEHVIRNESDYLRISEYIQNNPARWEHDRLNLSIYPDTLPHDGTPPSPGQPRGVAPTMNGNKGGAQ